jgi:hypothetical protein
MGKELPGFHSMFNVQRWMFDVSFHPAIFFFSLFSACGNVARKQKEKR